MVVKIYQVYEVDAFSDTAPNFFHFVQAFGNKLELRYFLTIWMVEDRIQDLNYVTCGIFQLYFSTIYLTRTKTAKYRTMLNSIKRL